MCLTNQYWYIVHLIVLCSYKAIVHLHTCQKDCRHASKSYCNVCHPWHLEKLNVRGFFEGSFWLICHFQVVWEI